MVRRAQWCVIFAPVIVRIFCGCPPRPSLVLSRPAVAPAGRKKWAGFAASLAWMSLAAVGEEAVDPTVGASGEIEEVVVVGTRRSGRSTGDLPVPVDVLRERELATHGYGDMLDALTAVTPSYNVGREPISDAATLIRPVNLRGLPADSTLILVNGKRRHRGAVIGEFISGINKGAQAVDIMPLAGMALQRVEVLRDGASAQYGSDAIAGVINFVMEDDPESKRLQVQYGSTYEGDGDQVSVTGSLGARLGSDGFGRLTAQFKDSNPTSRGSQDPQASFLVDNGYAEVADPVVIWGAPKVWNDFKVLGNAAVEAGVGEAYAFGTWSGREVDGSFFYRNPNTRRGVFADATGENLLVADLTPGDDMPCPTIPVVGGLVDTSLRDAVWADPNCFIYSEWWPGGFTPRFGGKISDVSIVAGWRGDGPRGLTYDFSISAGRNEATYRINNTVNASYGPDTPVEFDLGMQSQFERLINADFTIPVDIGAYSSLNVAFGAQHHKEVFRIEAGDTESWAPGGFENQGFSVGSNGFQGFSADVAGRFGRDSRAGYVDLDVDVSDRWLVSAAVRHEDFSDFGDTTKGKFATRYQVSPALALRGAISSGFRAPSVGQSNLRRAATTFVDGRLVESLTLPPTNPVAVLKGGKPLKQEESVNLSLGAAFSLGNVDVTLDWFRIEVDGRIALTQQNLSDQDRADLIAADIVGAETVTAVTFFVNDIDSKTTGIDLVVDTGFDWAAGRLNVTLAGNLTDTEITDPGVTLTAATTRELEDALPDMRATLTADYTRGAWSGLIRVNYYGSVYEHLFNCESCAITTDSMAAVDAELTWRLSRRHALTLGARNLFDRQPDKHRFAGVSGYLGADYPLNHPSGFDGGGYYVRLGAEF